MKTQPLRLEPFEFLRLVAFAGQREGWTHEVDREILVGGDVDLRKHPLRKVIEVLPRCTIVGNLYADGDCALRKFQGTVAGNVVLDGSSIEEFSDEEGGLFSTPVSGNFSAKRCRRLKTLYGTYGADVDLSESGVENLGEKFSCTGTLSLKKCQNLKTIDCSAGMIVAEYSSLEETGPNTRAARFYADGCQNFRVATAIAGLQYAKYDGSGVMSVSHDFRCRAEASFLRCRRLTNIAGEILRVEVSCAPLERIDGLRCRDILFLDCENLPDTFRRFHADTAEFVRCGFSQLPAGIPESAGLTIAKCRNFFRLPKRCKGDLKLQELPQISEVPEGFFCGGNLEVKNCEGLTEINGVVGGDLEMLSGSSRVTHLGIGLEVRGNLYVCPNSSVRTLDCAVGGKLQCAEGSVIRETGSRFRVARQADFSKCRHLQTLRGEFGGDVILDGSFVRTLGADFECGGNLFLRNTRRVVMINCHVGGSVVLEDSSLEKTGPAFRCGQNFCISGEQQLSSLDGLVEGCVKIHRANVVEVATEIGGGKLSEVGEGVLQRLRSQQNNEAGGLLKPKSYTQSVDPSIRGGLAGRAIE